MAEMDSSTASQFKYPEKLDDYEFGPKDMASRFQNLDRNYDNDPHRWCCFEHGVQGESHRSGLRELYSGSRLWFA